MFETKEPIWIPLELIEEIHRIQLLKFGGLQGMRDKGALESALGRPQNQWAYENSDMPALAAAYGFGLARNHAFNDGNKRVALLAIVTFLGLNDIDFSVEEANFVVIIRDLAAGLVDEQGLTQWIRDSWPQS
jgi:death on curing protein